MKSFIYVLDFLVYTVILHTLHGEVIDITKKNMKTLLDKQKYMIVYVTEPKCQECAVSYPKFLMTSQLYSKSDIIFGRIKSKSLAAEFNVETFPTIIYSLPAEDTLLKYKGEITVDTLVQLLGDEVERKFSDVQKRYILDVSLSNYKELAEIKNVCKFFLVFDDITLKQYEMMQDLSVIYKNDDVILFMRADAETESALVREIKPRQIPSVLWIDKVNKRKYYAGDMELQEIMGFIAEHTGVRRKKDGSLPENAGRVQVLDKFIAYHVKQIHEAKDMENIVKKATSLAEKQKGGDVVYANYYVDLLKMIASNGSDDVARERENLLHDLQFGDLGPKKSEHRAKQMNIINVIVEEFGNLLFSGRNAGYEADSTVTEGFFSNVHEEAAEDREKDTDTKIHRHEEL